MAPVMTPSSRCRSAGRVTAGLLLSFFALSPYAINSVSAIQAAAYPQLPPVQLPLPGNAPGDTDADRVLEFKLKHVFHHGTYKYPELHKRLDVPDDAPVWLNYEDGSPDRQPMPRLRVRQQPATIQRLADRSLGHINSILEYKQMTGHTMQLPESAWITEEVRGPNVTDKESVLTFSYIAANAYVHAPGNAEWRDVKGGFNYTDHFGWEGDGLRGHIFADTKNSTVVIGLKGTSPPSFDGGETTINDRENDNLYFSCCCGQGGNYLWRQVCDCMTSSYTCNSTCLVTALRAKYRYYSAVQDLYHNVTELYPDADVWVSGHSLGGAISSLLSLTYGLPAITFEAVPDALPASRLGLPVPPGHQIGGLHQRRPYTGAYHFGHTADPVYMGTCNTASSICSWGGYAMQSVCHTGHKCVYDTVGDLGWRVGIGTHKINAVIKDVLERYDDVPTCAPYVNCTDCYPWEFFESNGTERTSTSSSMASTSTSLTRTRTETCKTPGWWGCLDETTTSGSASTTSSSSTSTCKTPGWFGCKDETTTTTTTSSTSTSTSSYSAPASAAPSLTSVPTPTTTCEHPGWFGCKDSTIPASTTSSARATATSTSTSCTSKEWFGLICVDPSTDAASGSPSPTPTQRLRGAGRGGDL